MMRLGIDIGSKTIKLVLLDAENTLVYSRYIEHRSQIKRAFSEAIHDVLWRQGDCEVEAFVTGSAGMRVVELFEIPFIQEVVALKRAVRTYSPQANVILEMGGEDTKLVYLDNPPEQRMNTICAGGTGSFIEMMASMMGVRSEDFQSLAANASVTYPIASRCAVFAKSDVRPLLNSGARKEDIAGSVLRAVCMQAIAGLSGGRPLEGTVVLLGGPFRHIPALRDAFCEVSGISKEHALVPENAHLMAAIGATLGNGRGAVVRLADFEQAIIGADFENLDGMRRLEPLFTSQLEYERFRLRHAKCRIPQTGLVDSSENLFLGIDAGSTTVKIALIDESGALCDYDYAWNEGDISVSLTKMLTDLYGRMYGAWMPHKNIARSCSIGYGEEYCKAAFGVDFGEVETVAHLRAAQALVPDVDFLLDIGGQDIKCFYVKDGAIVDIVLNEACSSGCGSLFDSVARSLKRTKEKFATEALYASAPVDLGTRCATFMDSRVKHAQKEGASLGDIAAGVCYSTVRNALFKVVRRPDFSQVGSNVVVQGGAFANDAILRAFEKETGVHVKRPDLAQVMGAYGAALLARDEWLAQRNDAADDAEVTPGGLIGPDALASLFPKKKTAVCPGCTNSCRLTITTFGNAGGTGRTLIVGNKCQRGEMLANGSKQAAVVPPNVFEMKRGLIAKYFEDRGQADGLAVDCHVADTPTVGIPLALSLYESYPFWATFFRGLGFRVIAPSANDEALFRLGMDCIPIEGSCYPAKLLYGQVKWLIQQGAQSIFLPYSTQGFMREGLLGLPYGQAQTCPYIELAPELASCNMVDFAQSSVELVSPDFRQVGDVPSAVAALASALERSGLSVPCEVVQRAFIEAQHEYSRFYHVLDRATAQVMKHVDEGVYPAALVIGHGYHADIGISHGIDKVLADLGYAVIEQMDYAFGERRKAVYAPGSGPISELGQLWATNAEALYSAKTALARTDIQPIFLRSFGCGVDAAVADAVADLMHAANRPYAELKLDQIVDLAAVKIRLRSLAYAIRHNALPAASLSVDSPIGVFVQNLRVKGDLATYLRSDNMGAALVRALLDGGAALPAGSADASDKSDLLDDMGLLGYQLVLESPEYVSGELAGPAFLLFCGQDGVLFMDSWADVEALLERNAAQVEEQRERKRQKEELEAMRRAEAQKHLADEPVHHEGFNPWSMADRWGAFNSFPVEVSFPEGIAPPGEVPPPGEVDPQ